MSRKREINPGDASVYFGVIMSAAFDPTSNVVNLARSAEILNQSAGGKRFTAKTGLRHLLDLAYDFIDENRHLSSIQKAEMLLEWVNRWLQADDWKRLQATVRKRRQYQNSKRDNITL